MFLHEAPWCVTELARFSLDGPRCRTPRWGPREQNGVLNGGPSPHQRRRRQPKGLSRRDATSQGLVRIHGLKQRGDLAALIEELTSPNNLGRTGDPRALEPLIGLLRSEDVILRRAAAAALGGLGDQRARDALLAARAGDRFWRRGLYNKAIRSVTKRRGEPTD